MPPKVDASSVAYGAIMFCSSMLNNIFISYYIDLFVNVVRIDAAWFYVGQTVFMIWNAANDPLLGWVSDTTSCHEQVTRGLRKCAAAIYTMLVRIVLATVSYASKTWAERLTAVLPLSKHGHQGIADNALRGWARRVDMIRFGGLLWCAAFLSLWWPWSAGTGSGSNSSPRWIDSLLAGLHFTGISFVGLCAFCLQYVLF